MAPQVRRYQHCIPWSRDALVLRDPWSRDRSGFYRPLELSAVLMPLAMAFAAELGLADPARAAFMLE